MFRRPPPQSGRVAVRSGRDGHRNVTGPSTRSAISLRRSRSEGSAQWMSSITTMTGPARASAVKNDVHARCSSSRTSRGSAPSNGHLGIVQADGVREGRGGSGGVGRDLLGQQVSTGLPHLLHREVRRVGVEDAGVALQDLRERPVRHAVAVRQAPSPEDQRCGIHALGRVEELAGEPGLADAGVAVEGHEVRTTIPRHPFVDAPQHIELSIAPDHRCGEAGDAARPRPGLPEQAERTDPIAFALEFQLAVILEREPTGGTGGALGHQHGARVRGRLEARRGVHGVAGHHRLAGLRRRHGEHLAGVHADADLQRDVVRPAELGVEVLEATEHPQRGPEGAGGVVLVRGRHPERGHDGIADELLDGAALGFDLLAHRRRVGLHHLLEPLRVQPFAEGRRSGDVGEDHRDELAFLTRRRRGDRRAARRDRSWRRAGGRTARRPHALGQRRAARSAEPCVVCVRGATRRADDHRRSLGEGTLTR